MANCSYFTLVIGVINPVIAGRGPTLYCGGGSGTIKPTNFREGYGSKKGLNKNCQMTTPPKCTPDSRSKPPIKPTRGILIGAGKSRFWKRHPNTP